VSDWKVQRSEGRCVKTGREFAPGERYHVVLYRAEDGLRRDDYSEEAWTGPPEDAFCCFKTRKPEDEPDKKKKRLLVDDDVLVDFFLGLKDEQERTRLQFRFVLALILMRKRLVKYEDTREEDDNEVWKMRLMRDRSLHSVVNPRLTEEEIQEVSRQLTAVLHGDARELAPEDEDLTESSE
jgi:hypothetical protein